MSDTLNSRADCLMEKDVSKNLKISGPFMGGMPEKKMLSKKNIKRQQTEAE